MRTASFWFFFALYLGTAGVLRAEFDPKHDTFAFGNETLWAYGNQHRDSGATSPATDLSYSRRCFVMSRALIQFHKFTVFEPKLPQISSKEYARRIRALSRIPVSQKRNLPLISFPGFANLQGFSAKYPALLQENLGNWWPTYFRFGNWRMAMPFLRSGQRQLASNMVKAIDQNELPALYITRFKPLNHSIVAYDYDTTETHIIFSVIDPNLPGKICYLTYDRVKGSFYYQKTWYYKGGLVNALQVYHRRWL